MKTKNIIVYIDMDEVLADFTGAAKSAERHPPKMFAPFFFENLIPIDGSLEAVRQLIKLGVRIEILTQPVKESVLSYTEKAAWIAKWIPELVGHVNMTQDKTLFQGDILIDDSKKWSGFSGMFLHFDRSKGDKEMWKKAVEEVTKYVRDKENG